MPAINYFSVQVNANPSNFDVFGLTIYRDSPSYYIYLFAQMVTGQPVNNFQVQIASNINQTVSNLVVYLQNTYGSDPNLIITANDNVLNFELTDQLDYQWMPNAGNAVDFTVYPGSTIPPTILDPIVPLKVKDFSISIIDTYENEKPLILETASEGACRLKFSGGDDLFSEIMSSKLEFNMHVPERDDAHFIHLLTGDENRYLVKLDAIDEDENVQLVWQGFLLPDQYREPFSTGNIFVYFTATDCLATLKGKFFEPWYYQNKFPIAVLIGYILERTGLQQPMMIKPSVVPATSFIDWKSLNVDLRYYRKDNDFKDLYTILVDVLKANLLTLKSYRGYWWIEGLTRKKDVSGQMISLDAKGRFFGEMQFVKNLYPLLQEEGTVLLNAVTPFKSVNYSWKVDGDQNMYSDTVVSLPKKDIFFSSYFNDLTLEPNAYNSFSTKKWKNWLVNLNEDFWFNFFNNDVFSYRVSPFSAGSYSYSEAQSLSNYMECSEIISVKPDVFYEIELIFFYQYFESSNSEVTGQNYNNFIPFQLLLNGNEIISNRPSFSAAGQYSYLVKNEQQDFVPGSRFLLKTNFRVNEIGEIVLRVCVPIGSFSPINDGTVFLNKLQIKAVDGYDENENVSAIQDINYTREYDLNVNWGCTQDRSVKNSFGLGWPTSENFFLTVRDAGSSVYDFTTQQIFLPSTDITLNWSAWFLTDGLYELLFVNGWNKALFLEKNGQQVSFDNLYGSRSNAYPRRAAFLTYSVGGTVRMPKDYFEYPFYDQAFDKIKVMYVRYANEVYSNRLNWKIYDSDVVREFSKTMATAVHNVYCETLYNLECDVFGFVWPDDLPTMLFDGEDRMFIPTDLTIDLFSGKTRFVGTEAKYKEFTDLIYK